jgi:hypothetical protein
LITVKRPRVKGLVCALIPLGIFCILGLVPKAALAQSPPDSLTLQRPENVRVWRTVDQGNKNFVVFVNWEEPPDSTSAIIHPPDTSGWTLVIPPDSLSIPRSRGHYTGNIDRTVLFKASQDGGVVGGPGSVLIQYFIKNEEEWIGRIEVGAGYSPGAWLPIHFKDDVGNTRDFGLELSFPPGNVGPGLIAGQAQFIVGMEDFEGYHIWRGIEPDGSDLEIIGEISKEEAHRCNRSSCWIELFRTGVFPAALLDLTYLYGWEYVVPQFDQYVTVPGMLPTLREYGIYNIGISFSLLGWGCLGSEVRTEVGDNELVWFDCHAFNGFTYQYLVTTFDRGYSVLTSNQGLTKIDRCQPSLGIALPDTAPAFCQSELVPLSIMVRTQSDLREVYAVPNPFRTGGSRLTTENYHNFPDEKVRFVNVPADCTIRVYTVSGDLVWEREHSSNEGNIEWDGKNRGGQDVTSGVYIYSVKDNGGGQSFGKLIVIR